MEKEMNEVEQKALIGLLYNHVSFGTTMQVFGEASADNARIETMRGILKKLLVKYSLIDTLSQDELLILGITDLIPKEKLEAWALQDTNKHLQLRATFFLKSH